MALLLSNTIYKLFKVTKLSKGTAFPGKIALSVCPNFLHHANSYVRNKKINITGTNGKTTTTGLLTHILKHSGSKIINNSLGANMLTGVVTTFATQIAFLKKYDYSIIESDEGYLEKIYEHLCGDYLIVTNLFRDQTDRYGDISITKKLIQKAIDKNPNITLFLNADDPNVSDLINSNIIYYGINSISYAENNFLKLDDNEKSYNCTCGKSLHYEKIFYANEGHYYCDCGKKRPQAKYNADLIMYKDYFILNINNEKFKVPLSGLYNAYNALAAISMAIELGVSNIQEALDNFHVAFGRSEIRYLNKKPALIQLIKNPIGANEVLKTIDLNSAVLIAVNDNYADGRDISWLWEANFEILKDLKSEIIVTGTRANDIALRLQYADCKNVKIISNLNDAINSISKTDAEKITIYPTYTALLKINEMKCFKLKF